MAQLAEDLVDGGKPAPDVGRDDDLPVGVQISWRLRALILSGRLGAGERLPGVRELAEGAGVNVNTARAIYRRLEREGLTVSLHGQGTFVSADAEARSFLEQLAAETAEAARTHGIEPRDVARALYVGSDPAGLQAADPIELQAGADGVDEAAARQPSRDLDNLAARRTLRAQIGRLEAKLAPYAKYLEAGQGAPLLFPEPLAHVADIGELEATRDQLMARLREARGAAEAEGGSERAARSLLGEMVKDPAAHKWEVISNRDLGEPGCTTYEVRPAWGPVGALMNWWQVRVSGGCPPNGPLAAAEG